jgi:intracellular multiplication protein IcmK
MGFMKGNGKCISCVFMTAALFAVSVAAYADDPSQKQQDFNQLVSQMQPAAQQAVPVSPAIPSVEQKIALKKAINHEAFNNLLHTMLPLSPNQIHKLHTDYNISQKAAAQYPGARPPKATSSLVQVDLSPGSTPPVVRLQKGMTSTIVFVDATGQPWPITSYSSSVTASVSTAASSPRNVIVLSPSKTYNSSNMAVTLSGLNTPVMLQLISGQNTVDYRMDLRIPARGPNATEDYMDVPSAGSPFLLSILDGVPPQGAKALAVVGSDGSNANSTCQAWKIGDEMFVRTRMTLLSPGFVSKIQSGDGTNAYEMPSFAPTLLMMRNGQVININIGGL